MSHKIVAQRFGSWAEFRMSPIMLLLMLVLVYEFGILFAAPGAVMIYGGKCWPQGERTNLACRAAFKSYSWNGFFPPVI